MTTASRRIAILVVGLATLLGASTFHAASNSNADLTSLVPSKPIVMRMRRLCWMCPSYVITLASDGKLTYEGQANALIQGVRTYTVDEAIVQEMLMDFVQSGFLELDNTYPSPGADKMTVSISIEMNDLSKAVLSEDRYGPALLLALERKMDDLPGMRALSGWPH